MNLNIIMVAAGFFLLIGLMLWKSTFLPIELGLAAVVMLSIRAAARKRPLPRETLALIITFALCFAFILFDVNDLPIYDGSPKSLELLAIAAIFALAWTAMLAGCYYFFSAIANIKPEKRLLANFVAPVAMLLPQLFTEIGNTYRKRFLLAMIVFGACFALIITLKTLKS